MERCTLIGTSPATLRLIDLAKRVAICNTPALLVGPPGTEFEVVAEFIHQQSSLAEFPFKRQRCISWEASMDAQLWSGTGTLFVEGIEHASLPLQVRLLSELEKVRAPLQSSNERLRIIASSSRSLSELVANGLFLEDLYWQLSAVTIPIPSLSERSGDIAELAGMLLSDIAETHRLTVRPQLTAAAIEQLQAYSWPGNYRELVSKLLGAALLATQSELSLNLVAADSAGQSHTSDFAQPPRAELASKSHPLDFQSLVQSVVERGIVEADRNHRELHQFVVDHVESALIRAILSECEHVQTKTATRLGINRNTLHKKMKDFGLESGISDK